MQTHMLVSLGTALIGHLMPGLILTVKCHSLGGGPWVSLCAQAGDCRAQGTQGCLAQQRFPLLKSGWGGCPGVSTLLAGQVCAQLRSS